MVTSTAGPRRVLWLLVGLMIGLPIAAQAPLGLDRALPPDCVAVATVVAPGRLVADLGAAIGPVPDGLPPAVQGMVSAGMLFVRTRLGGSIERFVNRVAGNGLAFGVQLRRGRPVPLLVLAAREPVDAVEFFERIGAAVHHEPDTDIVLVSSPHGGLDTLRAGWRASRSAEPQSRPAAAPDAAVHGRVDLSALRDVVDWPSVTGLDAAGKVLFAPLLAVLPASAHLDVELDVSDVLQLTLRCDGSGLQTRWRGLMAEGGGDRSRPPLPADGLLQLTLDRSLTALLRQPERFLSESETLDVQSFLSIADAIDGAATSFVEDLMGGLEEPIVLTVFDAPDGDDTARSPLALPGFALSAGIADVRVEPVMRRAAQVLTLIINGERAQNRQRPFMVRRAWSEHGKGLCAEPPMWRGPGRPPVEDGLSPTLLFGQGHVVLASTHAAADRLLAALRESGPRVTRGDRLELRGPAIAAALERARRPLELARMLDEGETETAAKRFWDAAIVLVRAIGRLEVTADYAADGTTLGLTLERAR
ncbi:MAG: hypothetical protein NXI31_01385 [bacterium]|nr:hypothetical protein [bacterium]